MERLKTPSTSALSPRPWRLEVQTSSLVRVKCVDLGQKRATGRSSAGALKWELGSPAGIMPAAMYYDRSLEPDFVELFARHGIFGWLGDEVLHSEWARQSLAHMQFRRARGRREMGGIQIYFGRTSPLEILWARDGGVKLMADKAYRNLTKSIFAKTWACDQLMSLSPLLRAHLQSGADKLKGSSFVTHEAKAHAGMMRRYGPLGRPEDPFRALDSEVRVGYDSEEKRKAFLRSLRQQLGLSEQVVLPEKLDALGVLIDGSVALVEVKDRAGDLRRAAIQAATHVAVFQELKRKEPLLRRSLERLIDQKHRLELLGSAHRPNLAKDLPLVPIIAAPDDRSDWYERWTNSLPNDAGAMTLLGDLRFWRLDDEGAIAEDRQPKGGYNHAHPYRSA
jgi:hypothetical protein